LPGGPVAGALRRRAPAGHKKRPSRTCPPLQSASCAKNEEIAWQSIPGAVNSHRFSQDRSRVFHQVETEAKEPRPATPQSLVALPNRLKAARIALPARQARPEAQGGSASPAANRRTDEAARGHHGQTDAADTESCSGSVTVRRLALTRHWRMIMAEV